MAHAERMARFLELTSSFAHQLNNDLAAVLGYAEMLAAEGDPSDISSGWAMEIFEAGTRIRSTVERFHMLHGIARAELCQFDISQLVRKTLSALLAKFESSLALKIDIPQSPLTIRGNPNDFVQLLRHLCQTAIDNIPGGGHLYLAATTIATSSPKHLTHGVLPEGEYVRITVLSSAEPIDAASIGSTEHPTINDSARPGRISGEFADLRRVAYLLHGLLHMHSRDKLYSKIEIYLPLA